MQHLTQLYRITEANLALRRQFLKFSEADHRLLAGLAPWADRVADKLAREFYDHQFTFTETRLFFEGHARLRNLSLSQLRKHLEHAQATYFRQIFSEAATGGGFGLEFFEKRLLVGKRHNLINLPMKWFIGSYANYFNLVRSYLFRSYWYRPFFRSRAERAILAIFIYDMQAITESFLHNQFETIGLNLSQVEVSNPNHDLSDRYDHIKKLLSLALGKTRQTSFLLGETASGLADASARSQSAIRQITQAADAMSEHSDNLLQTIDSAASSIAEMAASVQQVAGNTETLAAAVQETSASIEEMGATIAQVAENVRRASEVAEASTETAKAGQDAVARTVEGMQKIHQAIGEVVTVIERLGQASEEIGAIISVIDDIAEQTNLLALNAAIEAARAGEHGRGFAVVADEVRKLAERSAKATGEIAQLIKGIQQETDAAVASTQQGASAIEEGTARAKLAGDSLAAIVASVETVTQRMDEIERATQEQTRAAAQIISAVTSMNSMTEQVAAATRTQAKGSEQIIQAVDTMNRMAQQVSLASQGQRQTCTFVSESSAQVDRIVAELQAETTILIEAMAAFGAHETVAVISQQSARETRARQ